ncbi:MurR/RpiR family transcriptional regulator [Saccharospirillum alexandrii]|uniref:MurR/RpiR family transcriptional regulator n=1 Tax=Saccharospirillum alexandrii TaxID=2448477 RepID=UPI0037353E5B
MNVQSHTIETQLRTALPKLTRAERQVATYMLGNFPVTVLGSVASVARAAGVSSPTVVRLVQKLGYKGYPDFQAGLHEELSDTLASPLAKHDKWADAYPGAHILNHFADKLVDNLNATLSQIDQASFDATTGLLSDPKRRIYTLGGRLTHSIADYFATALKVMRGDVVVLSSMPNTWPTALLDMKEGDVLIAFDVRRYEPAVVQMVELAREQGVDIVLITDRWVSPAAVHARHTMPCHIEAPSAWDSLTPLMALVEALLAGVQGRRWEETSARLKRIEGLYERTRLFKRPR